MKVLANIIAGVFYALINALLTIITSFLDLIYMVFPSSPFQLIKSSGFEDILAQINYILPLSEMLTILEAWVLAIGIYYLYSIIARWVNAIE